METTKVTAKGWKNKNGTAKRSCSCGTWKQHWINASGEAWPKDCSIKGCLNNATLGAHIFNANLSGEMIVPACSSCNNRTDEFDLEVGVTLVSANKQKTCEA